MGKRLTLGTRLLVAFFIIAAFSSLVTTFFYIYFFSERIEKSAVDTLALRSHEIRLAIEREQEGLVQSSRFLSNSSTIRNFALFASAPKLKGVLDELIKDGGFDQIQVYGQYRQRLAATHSKAAAVIAGREKGVADMAIHRAFHTGEAQTGIEQLYSNEGPLYVLTAAAPILTRTLQPKVVGAVLVRRLLNDNQGFLASIQGYFEGILTLYHQQHTIAISRPDSRLANLSAETLQQIGASKEAEIETDFDAGAFLARHIRLDIMDSNEPLILGIYLPSDPFVQTTREAIWRLLGVMSLCMLMAVLLAWRLTRNLLHPVRHLMTGVEQITSGNLDHVIRLQREDELGELARAFNSMSGQLREFFQVLHATVETLTRVGTSLSAEKDLERLLATLLDEARRVSNAQYGSLHGVQGSPLGGGAGSAGGKDPAQRHTLPNSVAVDQTLFAYVAERRELLHITPDSPLPPELDGCAPSPDATHQILAPLIDHANNNLGMLQLSNPRDPKTGQAGSFTQSQVEIVRSLASQAAVAIENARNYQRIERQNRVFSRFVPTEFLAHLGRTELSEVQLGDAVEQELVVMFSDIRAFTTLSEAFAPKEIFAFLNDYLNTIGPAVSRNAGFIDKFIGDAVMALFSDGSGCGNNALRGALEIRAALRGFNDQRREAGMQPLEAGIGMHFGPVTLGTMGFKERMESTVIGDTVNLASRIESLTKYYGIHIGASGDLLGRLTASDLPPTREVDRVMVRGRSQQTLIHEVLDERDRPPILQHPRGLDDYQEALNYHKAGDWNQADRAFSELAAAIPADPLIRFHQRRCRQYRENPPEQWTGATIFRGQMDPSHSTERLADPLPHQQTGTGG
jgi:class 3 adenylate cyclase/HAMP domain-containing protein